MRMSRVIRRALGAGVLALLLAASAAMAAAPSGPRLALVKASPKAPQLELVTVNKRGGDPLRLAGGARGSRPWLSLFSPLSWSPDGGRIAFNGIAGFTGSDDPEQIEKIFTVGADGSGLRPIPGTRGVAGPVFSPDGRTLAFTRDDPAAVGDKRWETGFDGSSIWLMDLVTGAQRQLTPWQDEVRYVATSFSPDGTTLLATHEDDLHLMEPEPVALRLDGLGSRRLLDDGSEPVYSPDGSKIALIRRIKEYGEEQGENTDLFVIDADGGGVRRLTRTPGLVELFPSWDPSSQRLAYVRLPANRSEDAPFGYRTALMQVNGDGSCQTKVVSVRRTYFFVPSWQPGPGRGAGRIEC